MTNEVWRDIKNYEGHYQVSNLGRVRSVDKVVKCGNRFNKNLSTQIKKGRIRKLTLNHNGYLRCNLSKGCVTKIYFVHRLVYEAFVGDIPEGMVINHKDENPANNNVDNLMVCTVKENNNWGNHNKKLSNTMTNRKDHSKPVLQYDLDGNLINEYPSIMEVERQLGFRNTNISACCKEKAKTAYGFIWKYK